MTRFYHEENEASLAVASIDPNTTKLGDRFRLEAAQRTLQATRERRESEARNEIINNAYP